MEKDIKKLLDRFMDGQTSIEEEEIIAEYLRSHDVDDELKAYKEMFAWFDKGMPEEKAVPARNGNKTRRIMAWASVAAAVMICLTIVLPKMADTEPPAENVAYPQITAKMTVAAADTAGTDTAHAVSPAQKTRRSGARRAVSFPAPPKTYMANVVQDSINEVADRMTNTLINRINAAQETMLAEIERQGLHTEQQIETILVAMDYEDFYETEENIYY